MFKRITVVVVAAMGLAMAAFGADPSGKWTATFDTQIGQQNYTYKFKVDGDKLTGTATSPNGATPITEGKVTGDTITFVENMNYQGNTLRIAYTGKVAGDEIKFTRNVADMVTEELTAKRAK